MKKSIIVLLMFFGTSAMMGQFDTNLEFLHATEEWKPYFHRCNTNHPEEVKGILRTIDENTVHTQVFSVGFKSPYFSSTLRPNKGIYFKEENRRRNHYFVDATKSELIEVNLIEGVKRKIPLRRITRNNRYIWIGTQDDGIKLELEVIGNFWCVIYD